MMRLKFILCLLLISLAAQAQKAVPIDRDSLEQIIQSSLRFLENEQVKQGIPGMEYKGEWPSYIKMRTGFLLLNNPKSGKYDSNCFSLAGIMNTLSEVYFIRPDLTSIPRMLDQALPQLMTFYSEGGFNFWPLLEPGGRMYMFHKNRKSELVRRPIQFPLNSPYIRKAANVVNDNDDTSQGLIAIQNLAKIHQMRGENVAYTYDLATLLMTWRDTARASQHWYNIIHFDKRESGAFLTWRALEEPFPSWNMPRLLMNNALFLFPVSTLYPHAFTPYIPYGCNDVDAVVNANILSALALNGHKTGNEIERSSQFIERKIKRKKWSRAGIYYPNRYHLHYAVIKAHHAGIRSLDTSASKIKKHLLKTIHTDGSYRSRPIVNKQDPVQSSIYALHALLQLGNPYKSGTYPQVEECMRFLIRQLHIFEEYSCLEGGVFFSGGTVIRNTMFWKSDAYTTALLIKCLVMYQDYLKDSETFLKGQSSSKANAAFD